MANITKQCRLFVLMIFFIIVKFDLNSLILAINGLNALLL